MRVASPARAISVPLPFSFFFFNDTATTEIYTLSLHDALPISQTTSDQSRGPNQRLSSSGLVNASQTRWRGASKTRDRKSTRLNSSHLVISYAVFCLKKKHHPHHRHRLQDHRQLDGAAVAVSID